MAIRAGFAQMSQAHDTLTDVLSQLNNILSADQNTINSIASNIKSEAIAGVLTSYAEGNTQQGVELANNLRKMDEFLVQQLQLYKSANETTVDQLTSLEGLLNQIN